jgi:hypothetical protein
MKENNTAAQAFTAAELSRHVIFMFSVPVLYTTKIP